MSIKYILDYSSIVRDYPFVLCYTCGIPLIYPVLCTSCCHYICVECIENEIPRCCDDRKILKLGDNINGKGLIADVLEELEIYCPYNKKAGCFWIGKRRDYYTHFTECEKIYKTCKFCMLKYNITKCSHDDICEKSNNWISLNKKNRISELLSISDANKFDIIKTKLENMQLKHQIQELNKKISSNQYKRIVDDGMMTAVLLDFASIDPVRIKPCSDEMEVITESQVYIPEKTGYVLFIAIGGGSGGCAGGTNNFDMNPTGDRGLCGEVKVFIVYLPDIIPINIDIGKGGHGGKGGYSNHDGAGPLVYNMCYQYTNYPNPQPYDGYGNTDKHGLINVTLPLNGEATKIRINVLSLVAKKAYAPLQILDGHMIFTTKKYNNNDIVEKISELYPNIKLGTDGDVKMKEEGNYRISGCNGGQAGLNIANFPPPIRDARDGTGYGSGGAGGQHTRRLGIQCPPTNDRWVSENGGNGASGCVIVSYVDIL